MTGEKHRTTIWLPTDLWKKVKHLAVEGGCRASDIVRLAIEELVAKRAKEEKEELKAKREPAVRQWFDTFNEMRSRWGPMLNPPRELRPLKLTAPTRKLVASRIEEYGIETLVSILYKVRLNDYLMGRGRWEHNGHRLSPSEILKVNSRINAIQVLQDLEDPLVFSLREKLGSLEKTIASWELMRSQGSEEAPDVLAILRADFDLTKAELEDLER